MNPLSKTTLGVCYFFMIYTAVFFYPKWEKSGTEATISWDVSGYYMYLPAIFIYHDIKHCTFQEEIIKTYKPTPDFQQAFLDKTSGNYVMKYSSGQAVLMSPYFFLADIIANHSSKYEPNGFSYPYQMCIGLGMLMYAFIGLYFLRLVLLEYFKDKTVAILLLAYVFASNYLNYSSIDQGLTHSSLFSIYIILIYLSIKFYKSPSLKKSFFIGTLVGLATLIRPTDMLSLLIPLCWNISSIQDIRDRFSFIKKHFSLYLLSIVPFFLLAGIQPMYWKYATGNYLVYSYQDQGFSWLNPHIKKFCWSYRCGWLRYSPLFFFVIPGFYFLIKRKINSLAIVAFILIDFYIVTAWDIWDYGGTSGRAMIQCYPILAFPLAAFLEKMLERRRLQVILAVCMSFFIYMNIWWIYHLHRGTLLTSELSIEYYWRVVGRWEVDEFDVKLLDNKDSYRGHPSKYKVLYSNDFEHDSSVNITKKNGNKKIVINEVLQNTQEYMLPPLSIKDRWIRVSADITCNKKEWELWKQAQFIVDFYNDDKVVQCNMIRIHRYLKDNQSKNLFLDAIIPDKKWNRIGIKFWNAGGSNTIQIDNLQVINFSDE